MHLIFNLCISVLFLLDNRLIFELSMAEIRWPELSPSLIVPEEKHLLQRKASRKLESTTLSLVCVDFSGLSELHNLTCGGWVTPDACDGSRYSLALHEQTSAISMEYHAVCCLQPDTLHSCPRVVERELNYEPYEGTHWREERPVL